MKPQRHRLVNRVLAGATVAVLAAVGLVLLLDDDQPPQTSPAQETGVPQAQCGQPATGYADQPFSPDVARDVAGVHAAACAGDYDALIEFVRTGPAPPPGLSAAEIVDSWRREDPAGVKLRAVAAVLEQPGHGSQGGLTFCDPNTGEVSFSRGTLDIPPGLSAITYPRQGQPLECVKHP
ncbi:hypothetical protein ACFQV2_13235 [Actinokineospora soli]|uniref:Uncharacterized protein n=1 Tax=Actinokineospora soli TaxID=1048753 RepID=A0ABW2TP87_9PSEU